MILTRSRAFNVHLQKFSSVSSSKVLLLVLQRSRLIYITTKSAFTYYFYFLLRRHQRHRLGSDQDVYEAQEHRGQAEAVLHVNIYSII